LKRFRFSIASLLALVLIVAVGLAALHASTDAWDGGVFALILLTLHTSALLAVHRRGRERAFWMGFTLFGSAYLLASLVPSVESRLPSSRGLAYLDSKLVDRVIAVNWAWTSIAPPGNPSQKIVFTTNEGTRAQNGQATVQLWDATSMPRAGSKGSTENFVRIGHSLLAFLMALVGGHLSQFLFEQGRRRRADEHTTSSEPATTSGEDDVEIV
jgi:hypothetical protein